MGKLSIIEEIGILGLVRGIRLNRVWLRVGDRGCRHSYYPLRRRQESRVEEDEL